MLSNFIVLIVELLNTSMEEIVDNLFSGVHHSAKKAKDIGSAAVMLSIINLIFVWVIALIKVFFYG